MKKETIANKVIIFIIKALYNTVPFIAICLFASYGIINLYNAYVYSTPTMQQHVKDIRDVVDHIERREDKLFQIAYYQGAQDYYKLECLQQDLCRDSLYKVRLKEFRKIAGHE